MRRQGGERELVVGDLLQLLHLLLEAVVHDLALLGSVVVAARGVDQAEHRDRGDRQQHGRDQDLDHGEPAVVASSLLASRFERHRPPQNTGTSEWVSTSRRLSKLGWSYMN